MELTHQLTPMLRTLRLSGILVVVSKASGQVVCWVGITDSIGQRTGLSACGEVRLHLRLTRPSRGFDPLLVRDAVQHSDGPNG